MKKTRLRDESGYALLSLLVALTIGLVLLASSISKPSAQFVLQRDNEEEAFFRAQQVSYAIQTYATLKGGIGNPQNLPTKLEVLLEKFNVQGKDFHILRKSALTDPLTGEEWKPVRLGDPKVKEFARTYMRVMAEQQAQMLAAGGGANPGIAGAQQGQQGMPPLLMMAAQAAGFNMANINSTDEEDEGKPTTASGFSLDLDSDSRPIVGVTSGLKKSMVRNYYTIETYDKAIFIAGVAVPGLNNVIPLGGGVGGMGLPGGGQGSQDTPGSTPTLKPGQCPPGTNDPRCPRNQNPNQ